MFPNGRKAMLRKMGRNFGENRRKNYIGLWKSVWGVWTSYWEWTLDLWYTFKSVASWWKEAFRKIICLAEMQFGSESNKAGIREGEESSRWGWQRKVRRGHGWRETAFLCTVAVRDSSRQLLVRMTMAVGSGSLVHQPERSNPAFCFWRKRFQCLDSVWWIYYDTTSFNAKAGGSNWLQ